MKQYIKPILAMALVAAMAVGGTLAYLQDTTQEVTNTFTFGEAVDITLTETEFGDSEDFIANEGGSVDMIPGVPITKDPAVEIDGEDCYVMIDVIVGNNDYTPLGGTPTTDRFVDFDINLYDSTTNKVAGTWAVANVSNTLETTENGTITYVLVDADGKPMVVNGTENTGEFIILANDQVEISSDVLQADLARLNLKDTDTNYLKTPTLEFIAYAIQSQGVVTLTGDAAAQIAELYALYTSEF